VQQQARAIEREGVTADSKPSTATLRPRSSDYASQQDQAAIAMTSHSRTGVVRAILGSVAGKVLRNAGVPVLVLHPPE